MQQSTKPPLSEPISINSRLDPVQFSEFVVVFMLKIFKFKRKRQHSREKMEATENQDDLIIKQQREIEKEVRKSLGKAAVLNFRPLDFGFVCSDLRAIANFNTEQ
jgi:hypothetical protein